MHDDENDSPVDSQPPSSSIEINCELQHVGAAASMSGGQSMAWITTHDTTPTVVYASHALLYLTTQPVVQLPNGVVHHNLRRPVRTLRTRTIEERPATDASPVITTVATVQPSRNTQTKQNNSMEFLVAGCSNGSLLLWSQSTNDNATTDDWTEHDPILLPQDATAAAAADAAPRSITTVDAVWITADTFLIAMGTSGGAVVARVKVSTTGTGECCATLLASPTPLHDHEQGRASSTAIKTVRFCFLQENNTTSGQQQLLLFLGTASPRYNKLHAYTVPLHDNDGDATSTSLFFCYIGSLAGHEDWIMCMQYQAPLLASGSQDDRIRLWRFRTTTATQGNGATFHSDEAFVEEDEDGESRLYWSHDNNNNSGTSVTLEAILYGHEGSVTGVVWHPAPQEVFRVPAVLISSSMDRILLLWAEGSDGIWAPLSRVGSAGGILGGSVGSTLLGYTSVTVDPVHGKSLISHAYGGALHVWNLQEEKQQSAADGDADLEKEGGSEHKTVEERMLEPYWEAGPGITGHFGAVTDLCWDASSDAGDFFFTVSEDATCRMWGRIPGATTGEGDMWMEIARPQVHGHHLSTIASTSTKENPLRLVTGAEEKEIRVFEGPKTTTSILQAACGIQVDSTDRVDRAFIPSLGLSNKASAAEAAEERQLGGSASASNTTTEIMMSAVETMQLPQERDLGAVSLWPETLKLFGHNTEIYCLASSASPSHDPSAPVLVASAAKARDADDAQIRLWDVANGTCVQVLQKVHKSTVASMCFSSSGSHLVSSGKDRRICLWELNEEDGLFCLRWAKDATHKRIVWAVDFCPFDESVFASGSRDGNVKIWKISSAAADAEEAVAEEGKFSPDFKRGGKPDAVTALAFAPFPIVRQGVSLMTLAVGLESGRIEFWKWDSEAGQAHRIVSALRPSDCPVGAVTRLAWKTRKDNKGALWLASCSSDHGCRVFHVDLKNV